MKQIRRAEMENEGIEARRYDTDTRNDDDVAEQQQATSRRKLRAAKQWQTISRRNQSGKAKGGGGGSKFEVVEKGRHQFNSNRKNDDEHLASGRISIFIWKRRSHETRSG